MNLLKLISGYSQLGYILDQNGKIRVVIPDSYTLEEKRAFLALIARKKKKWRAISKKFLKRVTVAY